MSKLPAIFNNLRLPVVGAPLFIISTPDLVIAQCKAGVVGSFPTLNAREQDGEPVMLDLWLRRITEELDRHNQSNPDTPAAPFAVNQIVHRSNARLDRDIEICAKWNVPIWITSLGARVEVNEAAHSCGGIALHDVINNRFAKKAIEKGADGLIAVAAGAGGMPVNYRPWPDRRDTGMVCRPFYCQGQFRPVKASSLPKRWELILPISGRLYCHRRGQRR